ncbi:MAG: biotin/lipoyl-containing protein [Phycisphaerae bacterium]
MKRITKYSKTEQWLMRGKSAVIHRATISDLYFEENDEIKKGELFAVLFNENGTCEITAPASGILISLPYEEGDSVGSEDVLATIDTR